VVLVNPRPADEQGAVLIVFALFMTTLLGFAALSIDLGYARQRKAQAQNSADFAALAGAGVLKTGTNAQAVTAARDYVTRNGFVGEDAEVHVPPVSGSRAGVPGCIQVVSSEEFPTMLGRVLEIPSVTLRAQAVACASPGLGGPYAVFAGSTTCPDALSFSGANRTINGGIHSNNDMKVVSSGTVINGDVTYLEGEAPTGNITVNPSTDNPRKVDSPLPYPEVFQAEDYAPGGKKALLAMSELKYHYAGAAEINELWLTLNLAFNPLTRTIAPGLYYTTGDIHLNGNGYNSTGATFVSRNGNVHLNGNNFTFSPWDPDGLVIASFKDESSCSAGQAVVKLNGNNHSWTGVMFAPQGPLDFAGTNIVASLNGRLVAQTVKLSGSSQTITKSLDFAGVEGGFELVE
jgi:hypothetical protein